MDDEDEAEPTTVISSGQAADMLEQCLKWYEQQGEATAPSLLLLKRIRDLAATKRYDNVKQITLSSLVVTPSSS